MKYILEPLFFAFDSNSTEKQLKVYLRELLLLDDWWTAHQKDMFVLSTTSETLIMNGFYPLVDTLKPLLEQFDINFISYKDISKMFNKYFNKSTFIDELCHDKMIIEKEQLEIIEPSVFLKDKRPETLHEELLDLIWYVICLRIINKDDEDSYILIAKDVSALLSISYNYNTLEEINGNMIEKEHNGDTKILTRSSITDFLRDENSPYLIWRFAETREDLDLGLRISVYQRLKLESLNDVYDSYNFYVQNSFFEDFCNGHYMNKPSEIRSALQAITDAVTEKNLRQVHVIRKGKGANESPLVKHGYSAKRRNITTSIKVSYWKKGTEYRIANMKEHDFFDISEEWC